MNCLFDPISTNRLQLNTLRQFCPPLPPFPIFSHVSFTFNVRVRDYGAKHEDQCTVTVVSLRNIRQLPIQIQFRYRFSSLPSTLLPSISPPLLPLWIPNSTSSSSTSISFYFLSFLSLFPFSANFHFRQRRSSCPQPEIESLWGKLHQNERLCSGQIFFSADGSEICSEGDGRG